MQYLQVCRLSIWLVSLLLLTSRASYTQWNRLNRFSICMAHLKIQPTRRLHLWTERASGHRASEFPSLIPKFTCSIKSCSPFQSAFPESCISEDKVWREGTKGAET